MFCPNCGTQLPNEAAFCSQCGTRLNFQPVAQANPAPQSYAAPEAPAYAAPEAPADPAYIPYAPAEGFDPYAPAEGFDPYAMPEQPKKKNMPLIIGLIAGLAAIAVLLCVVLCGGGAGSPEALVEKFYTSVLNGDVDGAKDCVHPEMWKEVGEGFEEAASMMAMFGDSVKFSVNGSENVTDEAYEEVQEALDDLGIDDKIGEIFAVEVSMTINFMGMEQTDDSELLVAELDGKYYVVDAG